MADRAPARARRGRAVQGDPAALGGPHARTTGSSFADAVKRKVYDGRLAFPDKQWPYFLGWNGQMSNAPGTTRFLPVVDNTRQYINVLLILL